MKNLILDSGAVTTLARNRTRSRAIRGLEGFEHAWTVLVPSLVLVECLSGQPHTDAVVNVFLKNCDVLDGPHQRLARRASVIRARAGRGSAVDAVIVAMAEPGGAVLTAEPTQFGTPFISIPTNSLLSRATSRRRHAR